MRILLTNDDGIAAPGLAAMCAALAGLGQVVVVAPATGQSATSHTVNFHRRIPTRPYRLSTREGWIEGVAVEGSPADCVKLACRCLYEEPFDLVVSGLNAGCNIGVNVLYSGTVAAALEGALQGLPAVAASLHIGDRKGTRWHEAALAAREAMDQLLRGPLWPGLVMNINVPIMDHAPPLGVRLAPVCQTPLEDAYERSLDLAGDVGFHSLDKVSFRSVTPDTDADLVFKRYTTVTPLHFDLTHHATLPHWQARLGGEP